MPILFILFIPIITSCAGLFVKKPRPLGTLTAASSVAVLVLSVLFSISIVSHGAAVYFDFFYADLLSALFILIIAVVTAASSLYCIDYIERDYTLNIISTRQVRIFYTLFNLFSFSMMFVTVVNNLGMLWVAIEMTTLVSAFLVGFYNNKKSVEAAWKYIIICSIGISFALLGTILVYYTASRDGGVTSLNWTDIMNAVHRLNPRILKMSFLFVLVGYGTKAGIAPMHTWLPDAHSQAPAPISSLLSGVLLGTAVYAILRFLAVINKCIGQAYCGNLLVIFGLLSIFISAGFVIVQKDIKRLLAYSSIEHIGIIITGIGFGTSLAVSGALFHIFNHAIIKSMMFLGVGSVVKKYNTSELNHIHGAVRVMPFVGTIIMLGSFALAGSPPFSVFMSEIMIIISAFQQAFYVQAALILLLLAVIFAGLIHHFSGAVFGKASGHKASGASFYEKTALLSLFILACVAGFKMPGFFNTILAGASDIVRGTR